MDSLSANRQHQHQTLVLDLSVFRVYTKKLKSCSIREVIVQFATGKMNFTILLISFSGICKQWLIVTQLLQAFNDVKAVM